MIDEKLHLTDAEIEKQAHYLVDIAERIKTKKRLYLFELVTLDAALGGMYTRPASCQPALVVEVLDKPVRGKEPSPGNLGFYVPVDTRILFEHDGVLLTFWYHHTELSPFIYPTAG